VRKAKRAAPVRRAERAVGRTGLKLLARTGARALRAQAARLGSVSARAVELGGRTVELGRRAVESHTGRRPPIQVSVDVAVPLTVAWDEWMSFDAFTEGVAELRDVARDGGRLTGELAHGREWEAEIVDEREHEAFAWRSESGTDCAGLITFHALAERLTRIELELDVVPSSAWQTVTLSAGLAARRAQDDLRRFKARVEFINPDEYTTDEQDDGAGRDADQ
jgi:uncharacterized membrane protein